jgi:GNAT superfamily N-acetyltransferase
VSDDAIDRDAVHALEDNLWGMWSRFGRGEGCALHVEHDALWFDTPIPTLPYNAVLRFAATEEPDARIDTIFEHYQARGVPFLWFVHPTSQPSDLSERLESRGLEEIEVCPGMSMRLDELPPLPVLPPGVEIDEVDEESEVREFLELVSWRWDIPEEAVPLVRSVTCEFHLGKGQEVRCWLARKDGAPVAKVVLHLGHDGIAGIYGVATKPEARGLGMATTLTLQALHEARDEGYERAILHSTPMAQSLYARIGFRPVSPFRIYAPPGSLHL